MRSPNKNILLPCLLISCFILGFFYFSRFSYAQDNKNGQESGNATNAEGKEEPIIVNGDQLEYSTDARQVTAIGNVVVVNKGTKLTCDKLTVNMQTKVGVAEGNARMDDKQGVIEGEKIVYNFDTKSGTIMNADFRANPYFGRASQVQRKGDVEFIASKGFATTCGFNHPHYRIGAKQINIFPKDKIQTKGATIYVAKAPIMYIPRYNHSLKDPIMHVQFSPGKSKEWGEYLLTSWRYNLTDYINGRVYFDYRDSLGVAEGVGANYDTRNFGKGDFKYYYTQERSRKFEQGQAAVFQRYLIRLRHKWDIDDRTDLTAEYYKIVDSKRAIYGSTYSFLKEYFFREYEKDTQPLSYSLLHHNFNYATFDLLVKKRANRWYDPGYLEKLPEATFSLPSFNIADTPFYFTNNSFAGNYNKKNTSTSTPAANATNPDVHFNRVDTTNKLSFPIKLFVFRLTPFVSSEQTFYDKDISGSAVARTVFYSGTDLSTKFYRVFNVNSHFLGMEINGLRHIITPTVAYSYNHAPTITSGQLRQIDSIDSIGSNNSATLELSNKFQTKRNGQSVDIADFRVNSTYTFKPKTGEKRGSSLSDIIFNLELLPYSWLRIIADATYRHSGDHNSSGYNRFSNVNYDVEFNLTTDRSFGFGQRYERGGSNSMTYSLRWRLNPKWYFAVYERFERGRGPNLKRGLREQEYTLARDLHCWIIEFNWNVTRGVGESAWIVMRLKAFPEMQFEMNQTYHAPKPGSQSEQ